MGKSKNNQNSFLVQGAILALASIISRIIGLIYRIPMNGIIGDIGTGYYGAAFEVYNILLIISSNSLPQAVSKTVSAKVAKRQYRSAFQILKGSMLFAVISGTIAGLIVYFGAEFFSASLLKTPYSMYALKVLAPVLLIVAILGVLRGFFQGLGTMMPSAVSQIIEQIINAIVSVWAAYVLFGYGSKIGAVLGDPDHYAAAYGAAGGTVGTAAGAIAGLLFMIFVFMAYMQIYRNRMRKDRRSKDEAFFSTFQILIITIIPVLLSTTIYNISGILDQSIFKNIALLQGYTDHDIDVWWGVFTGKYKLLINIPIAIASAMASSSVPSLTASFAAEDMERVRGQIKSAIRFIMIIALPSAVGLTVLAKPIFLLLFPGTAASADLAASMMLAGSLAVVFYSLSTLSNGLLQGIDRLRVPVINAAIALVAHLIMLVILMMFFRLNIYAVVLANVFFALFMCILNSVALKKYSGYKQEFLKTFVVPAISSLIMGAATYLVYTGIYTAIHINSIATLAAILVAVPVYAVSILLLKGMNEKDLLSFPKGALLVRIAKKLHLLK